MKFIQIISLLITFGLTTQTMSAQTVELSVLTGNVDNCTTIEVGTTITFARDASCLGDVGIIVGTGPAFTVNDILETSSDATFSYTFNDEGDFSVLCDITGQNIATFVACIRVVAPAPIPTLGEWALIILLLSMLITGVVYFKQSMSQLQVGSRS